MAVNRKNKASVGFTKVQGVNDERKVAEQFLNKLKMSGGYGQEMADGYGMPGGYGQEMANGYGMPEGYGQEMANGYGMPGNYGQEMANGYGMPEGYGQESPQGEAMAENAVPNVGFDIKEETLLLQSMGAKITDPKELGACYFTMRALGIKPMAAYSIVEKDTERLKQGFLTPPPRTGRINNKTMEPKSYYLPNEVDRLTEEDLNDPRVMEDVMKSMTKWKHKGEI